MLHYFNQSVLTRVELDSNEIQKTIFMRQFESWLLQVVYEIINQLLILVVNIDNNQHVDSVEETWFVLAGGESQLKECGEELKAPPSWRYGESVKTFSSNINSIVQVC